MKIDRFESIFTMDLRGKRAMLSICESQESCDFIDFFLNDGVPETPCASGLIGVRNLRDVVLVCCFF